MLPNMSTDQHDSSASYEVFRLAHISDPHLISSSGVRVRELLNKRVYGYLSWYLRRRAEHCDEVLAALREDMRSARPDHVLLTGDLTHLGLPYAGGRLSTNVERGFESTRHSYPFPASVVQHHAYPLPGTHAQNREVVLSSLRLAPAANTPAPTGMPKGRRAKALRGFPARR